MQWKSLDDRIPYVLVLRGRLAPIVVYESRDDPTRRVVVKQPGKYWQTKVIPGGDFQVVVYSPDVEGKPWRFADVVNDFEEKRAWLRGQGASFARTIGRELDAAVRAVGDGSGDPIVLAKSIRQRVRKAHGSMSTMPGLDLDTSLVALQCYALAEHRKYGVEQEERGGGRRLLPRVIRGIVLGKWSAADVDGVLQRTDPNRRGRAGGLSALTELEAAKGWSSGF